MKHKLDLGYQPGPLPGMCLPNSQLRQAADATASPVPAPSGLYKHNGHTLIEKIRRKLKIQ